MKIISKESIESKQVKRPEPSTKKQVEKKVPVSPVKNVKNVKHVKNVETVKHVRAKRPPKPGADYPNGPSYISESLERFFSLIRFNITFKLTLGYAIRLILLIVFLFVFIYASFSYYLFYNAQLSLSKDAMLIETILTENHGVGSDELTRFVEHRQLNINVFDTDFVNLYSSGDKTFDYQTANTFPEYDIRTFPQFPPIFETGSMLLSDGKMVYYAIKSELHEQTSALEATFPIGFVLCIVLILSSIR
ncbi:MAG TPA: hypothetical protein DCS67_06500, partial [Clostridiales bacterium UBA8960]|nr:hypothetical protein [Clostridiales bacterium UBA8960]